ncbi:MAG: hypothetical protein AAFX65_00835 [Cyanobacteria bacterium J06638_7]
MSGPSGGSERTPRRPRWPLVPLLLGLLALLDLRLELRLLADHLTLTGLVFLVRSHPLAVAVLLLQPSFWQHYR